MDKRENDPNSESVTVRSGKMSKSQEKKLLEAPSVEDFLPEHTAPVEWKESETKSGQPAPPRKNEKAITPTDESDRRPSGGMLVLQWLVYAFWFWYGVSATWLAGVVVTYLVAKGNSTDWSGMLAYPLASVIIMLAIAFVADWFYSRREPAKKTGGANIIMLLHVVPFVLIAIGSLIVIVFSLISMMLNSDPVNSSNGPLQAMLTSAVTVVLFAALALRAFYGGAKPMMRKLAWGIFGLTALVFIIAAIAGPAMEAARTKQDRLIESALPSLSSDIRNYTSKNDKLPEKLSDVTYKASNSSSAVQKLINEGLVTYKPNTLPAKDGNSYDPGDDYMGSGKATPATSSYPSYSGKRYYYQLCTTYKQEKKNQYNYTDKQDSYTVGSSAGVSADYRYEYVSSISSHPAGEVCYNLYATGKYKSSYY